MDGRVGAQMAIGPEIGGLEESARRNDAVTRRLSQLLSNSCRVTPTQGGDLHETPIACGPLAGSRPHRARARARRPLQHRHPPRHRPRGTDHRVYEQSLGRGAGGVENFVTHTLAIGGPEGCRLVAQGFQTDDTIRCKAMPDGDRLLVSFVSFGSGKVENKYGVKLYSVDQPLFAIAKTSSGLDTTWQGYSKAAVEGAPSAAFKKQARQLRALRKAFFSTTWSPLKFSRSQPRGADACPSGIGRQRDPTPKGYRGRPCDDDLQVLELAIGEAIEERLHAGAHRLLLRHRSCPAGIRTDRSVIDAVVGKEASRRDRDRGCSRRRRIRWRARASSWSSLPPFHCCLSVGSPVMRGKGYNGANDHRGDTDMSASDIAYTPILPEGWPRPRGFSHGVVATGTEKRAHRRTDRTRAGPGAHSRRRRCRHAMAHRLGNLVTVLKAAGGEPQHLVALRAYVTDIAGVQRRRRGGRCGVGRHAGPALSGDDPGADLGPHRSQRQGRDRRRSDPSLIATVARARSGPGT